MSPEFQVSVITPVYNAAAYVRTAVSSALAQPEVGQVILVDDAGPDAAGEICRELAASNQRVLVLAHRDGLNHGAGASRNLAIRHAACPFVAFLDADDWYLPGRFESDRRILMADPAIDGVYNAHGNHYASQALRDNWLSQGRPEVLTLTGPVSPEELPLVLLRSHPTVSGEFGTNSITVRRELFDRVGLFHEDLRLQQDTHMWHRMAALGRLAPGNLLRPVAIRRVHAANRMTRVADHAQYMELWWNSLAHCLATGGAAPAVMQAFRRCYAEYTQRVGPRWRAWWALSRWLARAPGEVGSEYGFFDISVFALTRRNHLALRLISAKNRACRWARSR